MALWLIYAQLGVGVNEMSCLMQPGLCSADSLARNVHSAVQHSRYPTCAALPEESVKLQPALVVTGGTNAPNNSKKEHAGQASHQFADVLS